MRDMKTVWAKVRGKCEEALRLLGGPGKICRACFDGGKSLAARYVLKDVSSETTLQAFLQTITLAVVVFASWIFVFARSGLIAVVSMFGLRPEVFASTSLEEHFVGTLDFALMLIAALPVFESVTGQERKAFVTLVGGRFFSGCDALLSNLGACVVGDIVVWPLLILLVALIAVARFRAWISIPVIAVAMYWGSMLAVESGSDMYRSAYRVVFADSFRPSSDLQPQGYLQMPREVIRQQPLPEPGYRQTFDNDAHYDERREYLLRSPSSVSGWISVKDSLEPKADSEISFGRILFCFARRCAFLPAREMKDPNGLKEFYWRTSDGIRVIDFSEVGARLPGFIVDRAVDNLSILGRPADLTVRIKNGN